jgi:hypothetical protein
LFRGHADWGPGAGPLNFTFKFQDTPLVQDGASSPASAHPLVPHRRIAQSEATH